MGGTSPSDLDEELPTILAEFLTLLLPVDGLKLCRQLIVVYHFYGLKWFFKVSSMVPWLKNTKSVRERAKIR